MASAADTFRSIIDRDITAISTIDHPFPSPPVYLFDGHLRLYRSFGKNVLVVNWDVSHPEDRRYRYDLITDTGLISKEPSLYHYTVGLPYCEQVFNTTPWSAMPRCIDIAATAIQSQHNLSCGTADLLIRRAQEVLTLASTAFGHGVAPWAYTGTLLQLYYGKLEQLQLQAFIRAQYNNYWLSPIMIRWIPWCIRNVTGNLAFEHLLAHKVFTRAPLRTTSGTDGVCTPPRDATSAAEQIAAGRLIPSLDVFLWSLAIAGIRHYGSDRDFFSRLADFAGNPSIAELQITRKGEDCQRFLQLSEDYGVLLDIDHHGDVQVASRVNNPSKLTRITTFSAVLVAAGERATTLFERYSRGEFRQEALSLA